MKSLATVVQGFAAQRLRLDPLLDATAGMAETMREALLFDAEFTMLPGVAEMIDALRELHTAALALKSGLVGVETAARTMAATYARMEARNTMKSWIRFGDN